jgi:WD40 repeat protein
MSTLTFLRPLRLGFLLLASAAVGAVDYSSQIQPLWDDHCVDCHSASDSDGEFALDTFAAFSAGGKSGKAVEPGKAQDSLLVKFLEGRSGKTGKNQFMPPGKRDHFTAEQIKLVRQWIDEGALGPKAGTAPTDPLATLPKVAARSGVKPIYAAATSADGKLAALGRYGSTEIIDLTARKTKVTLAGIRGKVTALAFSPAGDSLFVAAGEAGIGGTAYHFSTADGKLQRSMTGHKDALHALALSPDSKLLATGGYDQQIKLWDIGTGKELRTLKGHHGCINGLSFRSDGKILASASADRTVKLWDPASGLRLETFSEPTKEQFTVVFASHGKTLLAGGADSRIRAWSISATGAEGSNPILTTKFAHEGAVLGLRVSPDGKSLLSSASDKRLKVWNVADLKEKLLLPVQSDWPNATAWLGNDRVISARQDGSSALYALAKPTVAEPLLTVATATAMAKKPAAKPELSDLQPPGFQIGGKTLITASGKGLAEITGVKLSDARLMAKVVKAGAQAVIEVTAPMEFPRGVYELSVVNAAGESAKLKLLGDELPQFTAPPAEPVKVGSQFFGTLKAVGQLDEYQFDTKAGETIVMDITARPLGSKAETIQLEVFDSSGARLAFNRGLDSGSDPFIAFKAPKDGIYKARVSETTLDGSADHVYRLTLGRLPYVVGWWPLEVPAGKASVLNLIGYNLPAPSCQLSAGASPSGLATVPEDVRRLRSRGPIQVAVSSLPELVEIEASDSAQGLNLPTSVNGRLYSPQGGPDVDSYSFQASAGQEVIVETRAAAYGAPTDTKVEILTADGQPIERVKLRAVRDSWNNFRSVDANNPDIRLEFWTEMDLNDYVYFNGDVMRIFRNPRGPDAGFLFYNAGGKRMSYFGTTPTAHALEEPSYVVEPLAAGEQTVPNGLPTFSIPYNNDDDGERKLGRDSKLHFTAPAAGQYRIRVTDSRSLSNERFAYRLIVRAPAPDFVVALAGTNGQAVSPGASMGFSLRVDRKDDFSGPVTVRIAGLPAGWHASTPIVIQEDQALASGSLHAEETAPPKPDFSKVIVTAEAMIQGKPVSKTVTGFGSPVLGPPAKFIPQLELSQAEKPAARSGTQPQEVALVPGQTVPVFIRVDRRKEDGLLNFDVHNLPFGVIVDNIGLNGVQVRQGETLREIFLSAAKWVPEQTRLIHAAVASTRNEQDSSSLATSFPLMLKIQKAPAVAVK